MSGVAIENLLELWSAELRKAKAKLGWLIGHPSVVASAAAFLDTLLGPERRKTGWMRAEAAGDVGPWRQQAVLGRSHWDADALRDVVRDYALETLAEGDAVLVIDETACPRGFHGHVSSRARRRAASPGSTPARRARSPTARSVSSPPTSRPGATP